MPVFRRLVIYNNFLFIIIQLKNCGWIEYFIKCLMPVLVNLPVIDKSESINRTIWISNLDIWNLWSQLNQQWCKTKKTSDQSTNYKLWQTQLSQRHLILKSTTRKHCRSTIKECKKDSLFSWPCRTKACTRIKTKCFGLHYGCSIFSGCPLCSLYKYIYIFY